MIKIWFEASDGGDTKYYIEVNECPKREIASSEFYRIANIMEEFYNTDICKQLGPIDAAKQYLPIIAIENTYGKNYDGFKKVSDNIAEAATNVENKIDYEEKYKRLIKSVIRIFQDFGVNQPLCLVVDHIDKDIVDDIRKIREEETQKHLKNFLEKCQAIHSAYFGREEK